MKGIIKKNKDGTLTLEWLQKRKQELENTESVKWYLKFNALSKEAREKYIKKHNDYLEETKSSPAYLLFKEIKKAANENNFKKVRELASDARLMLANEDFKNPPTKYDPCYIKNDFFVSMYVEVVREIERQTNSFIESIEENLL